MKLFQIERFVRILFELYGPIAYRWKWYLFITPLICTLALSLGFINMTSLRIDDPSYVFTPSDSRWRKELKTFNDLWPLDENKFLPGKTFETKRFINILIHAKDGGSILRHDVLNEIELLNKWIMNNISIPTNDFLFNLTYQDLCLNYNWVCSANEHIKLLIKREDVNQYLSLRFPKGGTKDSPIYTGSILGNVSFFENKTLSDAKLTQLFYFLKQEQHLIETYSSEFSYAVEHFLIHTYSSNLIGWSFAHYQSLEDGLDENAKAFIPNFVVSFVVLALYALLCSFKLKHTISHKIDWVCSKPWLACAGMLTTVLSIISAFGFLFLLKVRYNVINTIIPFLIIAIGIDDMFLMNACWNQSDKFLTVSERLSKTLSHAGVAVTITNVTDVMSFAIGCITDLPGIQLFCVYACVSVAFSYLYQLTFFCGAMAIMGDVEKENRHCLFFYRTIKTEKIENVDYQTELKLKSIKQQQTYSSNEKNHIPAELTNLSNNLKCNPKKKFPEESSWKNFDQTSNKEDKTVAFFTEKYGPFILSDTVRASAGLTYLFYLSVALYGCYNFREGLNPGNLVTNDHYISKYFSDIKQFWKVGPQLHVAILHPPNITNRIDREKILHVVNSFENTPYTLGREGTVFFLLEYVNYLEDLHVDIDSSENIWGSKLTSWLKYTGGATQWASNIRMNKTDGMFTAFRFQIALKNFVEPNDHKHAVKMLRDIADQQEFDVVVYHEAFPFADQYLIILPATLQNVVISLLCMTVVSILLVPSLTSGVVIFISIVSINIGVFGYMTLWGVNLDAVSMISIIMSIGFAVDLSAHIVYAFVTSHGDTKARVIGALKSLGWPIFQGASSTIAGISILYTVDAYIILTFFKTIWLTMFIGAVHGLFFIPVFLSLFPVEYFHMSNSHK